MAGDISTVFFDAGNTLIWIDHEFLAGVSGIADVSVIKNADKISRVHLNELLESKKQIDFGKEYYGGIIHNAGIDGDDATEIFARIKNAEKIFPIWRKTNLQARPAVQAIKSLGKRTAVISNSDGKVAELLNACGLADLFEFIMDSHIEGIEKPNSEIFLRAARRMNVSPENCAYIGDIPAIDVEGSKSAGMTPVLYDPLDAWPNWSRSLRVRNLCELPKVLEL